MRRTASVPQGGVAAPEAEDRVPTAELGGRLCLATESGGPDFVRG